MSTLDFLNADEPALPNGSVVSMLRYAAWLTRHAPEELALYLEAIMDTEAAYAVKDLPALPVSTNPEPDVCSTYTSFPEPFTYEQLGTAQHVLTGYLESVDDEDELDLPGFQLYLNRRFTAVEMANGTFGFDEIVSGLQ